MDPQAIGLTGDGSRRRRWWWVAAALSISFAVVWFVAPRGDVQSPPDSSRVPEVTDGDPEPEQPRALRGRVETTELFASKDPFAPLVPGATSRGDAVAPPAEGATIKTFSADGTGVGSRPGTAIRLIETSGQVAIVSIDGTEFQVRSGDTFASHFQLLSVADDCATLLYGDEEFTLCEGEELLK